MTRSAPAVLPSRIRSSSTHEHPATSGPCAVPISGACIPPSKRSCAAPRTNSAWINCPVSKTACANVSPKSAPFQPGAAMVSALELAALGLQAQAGCPVAFSRSIATLDPGVYQVVVEYTEEAVGRLAIELAHELCHAALDDQPFDLPAALDAAARTGRGGAARPQHRGHRRRRRRARHSLSPAHRRQPGPVRLGQQTTAHPSRGNGQHQRDCAKRSPRTRN